jgi:hypothetical protein
MITAILIILGALALLVVVAALQPSQFLVSRRAVIAAAPNAVFPRVNDLPKWQAWSPWEKMDPAMKRSFEGPAAGVGASYAWDGNRQIGSGRMTIIESRPAELVRLKLEFFKPMACTNTAVFTFKPEGGGTAVTWSMSGKSSLMGKIFCLFMSMDKMCGRQFEEGLANLERETERAPHPEQYAGLVP